MIFENVSLSKINSRSSKSYSEASSLISTPQSSIIFRISVSILIAVAISVVSID